MNKQAPACLPYYTTSLKYLPQKRYFLYLLQKEITCIAPSAGFSILDCAECGVPFWAKCNEVENPTIEG